MSGVLPYVPKLGVWWPTWLAPCNDLTKEFVLFHKPPGTVDRIFSSPVQPAKNGNAMKVDVRENDVAVNSAGRELSGWRVEAVGPTEYQRDMQVRYSWSTLLPDSYPTNPKADGKDIFQVIFQWHQGGTDQGSEGSPPLAFIIADDEIRLDVHKPDAADPNENNTVRVGQWPIAPLGRGAWHDFQADIVWHPGNGSIRVWHHGTPVTFLPQGTPAYPVQPTQILTGLPTLYPPKSTSMAPPTAYLKVGLYRTGLPTTPTGPFVLYHDEISRHELRSIFEILRPFLPDIRLPRRPLP